MKILTQCEAKYVTIAKLEWIDRYKAMGYAIYNTETLPQYRIATRVLFPGGTLEVCVATRGKRWYPVRSFKDGKEAEEFISKNTVFTLLRILEDEKK